MHCHADGEGGAEVGVVLEGCFAGEGGVEGLEAVEEELEVRGREREQVVASLPQ